MNVIMDLDWTVLIKTKISQRNCSESTKTLIWKQKENTGDITITVSQNTKVRKRKQSVDCINYVILVKLLHPSETVKKQLKLFQK